MLNKDSSNGELIGLCFDSCAIILNTRGYWQQDKVLPVFSIELLICLRYEKTFKLFMMVKHCDKNVKIFDQVSE